MKSIYTNLRAVFTQGGLLIVTTLLVACDGNAKHAAGDNPATMPAKWVNSNLTIVANSSDSVTLTWAPKTDVASYRVHRSINTNFDAYYNDIADIQNPATTSFTDDKLVSGTTYYYIVGSINKDGTTSIIGRNTITTPTTDK